MLCTLSNDQSAHSCAQLARTFASLADPCPRPTKSRPRHSPSNKSYSMHAQFTFTQAYGGPKQIDLSLRWPIFLYLKYFAALYAHSNERGAWKTFTKSKKQNPKQKQIHSKFMNQSDTHQRAFMSLGVSRAAPSAIAGGAILSCNVEITSPSSSSSHHQYHHHHH